METRHRLTTGVAGSRRLLKREPTTEAAQFPNRMIGSWVSPACPPDIAQQFWDYVQAIEREHDTLPFDLLVASGVALPFPDDLDDARLTDKLWEVVVALSAVGVYLHSTDRLSDRDLYAYLYAYLWKEALRQPATIPPDNGTASWPWLRSQSATRMSTHMSTRIRTSAYAFSTRSWASHAAYSMACWMSSRSRSG